MCACPVNSRCYRPVSLCLSFHPTVLPPSPYPPSLPFRTAYRLTDVLARDRHHVLQPNFKDAFTSQEDVVDRLLPYHLFDYPDQDFDGIPEKFHADGMLTG